MSTKNVCKLKTTGKTSSKLINYFCNVHVNVSVNVEQSQGNEMLVAHGRPYGSLNVFQPAE